MFQKLKFKGANNKQLEAIKSVNGPLLIVAGPTTGKTYTLINRALRILPRCIYRINLNRKGEMLKWDLKK